MQYRRRLRSRIVLSFLVFGTLLSASFAVSALFLQNYVEDQLIGATLKQELDDYVDQLRLDPSVVEPFYTRIQGYITRPGDPNQTVSAEVRGLPEGVHEVRISGDVFKAAVRKTKAARKRQAAPKLSSSMLLDGDTTKMRTAPPKATETSRLTPRSTIVTTRSRKANSWGLRGRNWLLSCSRSSLIRVRGSFF